MEIPRVSFAPIELFEEMLGTTTGYMEAKTDDIVNKFLPYTNHIKEKLIIEED